MDPGLALARMKRMVAWTVDPVLSEQDVQMLVASVRVIDRNGNWITDDAYVPTFELNYGAAEGWRWKAGACVDRYKFKDGTAEFDRQEVNAQCLKMVKLYETLAMKNPQTIALIGPTLASRTYVSGAPPWWYSVSAA